MDDSGSAIAASRQAGLSIDAGADGPAVQAQVRRDKREWRARALAARQRQAGVSADVRAAADQARAALVLGLPAAAGAARVAAYWPLAGEPATGPLIERLRARGVTVLLPVLRPNGDFDLAVDTGGPLRAGLRGTRQPVGPAVGIDRAGIELIIVPALGVDRAGWRLGRGGGSYDRALAALPADVLRVALLHDEEVSATGLPAAVPAEPHDARVHLVVTESRVLRCEG